MGCLVVALAKPHLPKRSEQSDKIIDELESRCKEEGNCEQVAAEMAKMIADSKNRLSGMNSGGKREALSNFSTHYKRGELADKFGKLVEMYRACEDIQFSSEECEGAKA